MGLEGWQSTILDFVFNSLGPKPPKAPSLYDYATQGGSLGSSAGPRSPGNWNVRTGDAYNTASQGGKIFLYNPATGGSVSVNQGANLQPYLAQGYQEVVGPGQTRSTTPTLGEIYETGMQSIQNQFRGQQEIRAGQDKALADLATEIASLIQSKGEAKAGYNQALDQYADEYGELKEGVTQHYGEGVTTLETGLQNTRDLIAAEQAKQEGYLSDAQSYHAGQVAAGLAGVKADNDTLLTNFNSSFDSLMAETKAANDAERALLRDRTTELMQTGMATIRNTTMQNKQAMQNSPEFRAMSGDQQATALYQTSMSGAQAMTREFLNTAAAQQQFLADQEGKLLQMENDVRTTYESGLASLSGTLAGTYAQAETGLRGQAMVEVQDAFDTAARVSADLTTALTGAEAQFARDWINWTSATDALKANMSNSYHEGKTNMMVARDNTILALDTLAMQGQEASFKLFSSLMIPDQDGMEAALMQDILGAGLGLLNTDYQNAAAQYGMEEADYAANIAPFDAYFGQRMAPSPESQGFQWESLIPGAASIAGAGIGAYGQIQGANIMAQGMQSATATV